MYGCDLFQTQVFWGAGKVTLEEVALSGWTSCRWLGGTSSSTSSVSASALLVDRQVSGVCQVLEEPCCANTCTGICAYSCLPQHERRVTSLEVSWLFLVVLAAFAVRIRI